jgi:RNA polymerase sigma factor (sigma-70 family)
MPAPPTLDVTPSSAVPGSAVPGSAATAALADRAAGGDQAAWRELVERHGWVAWAVAREHGLSRADAADVAQVAWLNLAQRLGELRAPERLAAWLATTARRESLRLLALRRRETPGVSVAAVSERVARGGALPGGVVAGSVAPDPAGVVDGEDRDHTVWRALAGLPERCQRLLRLMAVAPELTHAQAARALGIQPGSVGRTRGRCLTALKQGLARHGIEAADQ